MKTASVHCRYTTHHEHWIMEERNDKNNQMYICEYVGIMLESMDKNGVTNDSYNSYAVGRETIVNVMNARVYVESEC